MASPKAMAAPSRVRAFVNGLNAVKAADDGNYVKPGQYVARIKSAQQSKNTKGEPCVIVRMEILRANPENAKGGNQPGDEPTWFYKLTQDSALRTVRAFLESVSTEKERAELDGEDAVSDDFVKRVLPPCELKDMDTGAESLFAGREVQYEAINVPTKAGGTFTKMQFHKAE